MKNHKYAMKKKMENVRSDQRHWGRGRQRPAQDVVRSFSAPHPAKVATMGRHRGLPARSLSANEAPSKDRTLDERYDLPYCDVTSPSEEEPEEVRRENLGPPKAEVPVGPPRRVIASLVPGSGLQRPQFRGPVRSYNPRVRDLARDTQTPQCWGEEDFMDGGVDSADLADVDEVGMSLQAAERQMMGTPGSTALQLGALTSPAAVMLAIQESDDDDETVIDFSQDIGSGKLSSGSEMPPTLMENMYKKNNSLSSRQNLSQLSNQTTLSQTQVTSSTTQMSASSSSRVASSRMQLSSSETKANSVKSDLSNFKNSISEMKTLSNFKRLRNSMENLVDATDPSCDPPPIVTFPDSETPPPNDLSMTMPTLNNANNKSAHMLSSMNSSSMDTLKYESRTSSASKTQVKTDFSSSSSEEQRRRAGDHSCLGLGSGTRSQHTATAVETRAAERNAYKEQRTLVAGEVTQQESGNMTSSLKVQTDSYSSEQKASSQQQARSNYTSSTGLFSQSEKHVAQSNMSYSKGICTVVSSQKSQLMNGTIKTQEDDLSTMTFEDLDRLGADSNPKEVEKAIDKYSSQLDAFVKKVKTSQANEQSIKKTSADLDRINEIIRRAWSVPTYGHELGHSLCNALRASGGLDLLMTNCDENNGDLQFSSAQLLEQCLTTENRAHVAENGLEKVVKVACVCTKRVNSVDHARVGTGILEHLFKHSEGTCSDVIKLGGLDAVLFECRKNDIETLRHCAGALANLSLYGGAENQEAMIKRQVPTWLFPLANHPDDNIKYYACLAIAVLVANSEIEAAVLQSGTLDLVEPFVTSHNPSEFARSNHAHAHGQSKSWLEKLVPVLSSKREEARNLAAFHFCMEAGIKQRQGNTSVFREIGAIEPLKNVASCPNAVASRYAAQALKLMGEELPHKLSQQVPLWSTDDVREWVKQIGFGEYALNFVESRVDGDLLLQLNESNLTEDIGLTNGIRRRRFTRELQNLKKIADYTSRDTANLNTFLQNIDPEYCIYTYSMLNAGVDKDSIKGLSDEQLELECGITNSIHRLRILDAIKSPESALYSMNERYTRNKTDAFVSYRRSNGSQLASLLKVHLSLRGFSVFIDVERLEAGKFDNNLLQSIRHAKNFLLVLTPKALDRCIRDGECKDWVHKEIVAALHSNCNIIPIIDDFTWPDAEELPEDMRQICHFNGVRWIHDYQDACVDRLERFMRGERGLNTNNSAPPTPAYLGRGPPTYQRMPSSDSSKGSDKDQTNGSRD